MLNTRQLAHKLMDISSQYWFYTHQNSNVLHKLWQFLHSRAIDEKYRRTISRKKEINVKVWNGGLLIFKPANFKHERIVVVCFTAEQTFTIILTTLETWSRILLLGVHKQRILRLKTELSNFAEEETTLRQNNSWNSVII